MSTKFANRKKPRKIGGDDEDEGGDQDTGPVVKRPGNSKGNQKSKLRLSFGPGETSMADDEEGRESEVVMPKRPGLGRRALENTTSQSGSGRNIPLRVGPEQDRPSYNNDYLKELRDSTPVTPKTPATDEEKERTVDVAAKFGEVMKVSAPAAIPSEAEIKEKKARRARLAKEHGATVTEQDYISLEDNAGDIDWEDGARDSHKDTRLIRDDEDFAEGFEEFVEDGRISLGKKAEREQKRKQREQMKELIEDAEGSSDEDDSDIEDRAAYEATQTRAAMGKSGRDPMERPKTPPKMTSLPRLSTCLDRLRTNLAVMEQSKTQMITRMEDLRKEKADIAVREVEIQALIKEAGDNYERLKEEAGQAPKAIEDGTAVGDAQNERGLESFGSPMKESTPDSENES